MLVIGQIEAHVISDGIYWADGGGAFGLVPKVIWERKVAPDEYNRIPMGLNCLLLNTPSKTILIDTGLGNKLSPKLAANFGLERPEENRLLNALGQHAVTAADIDIVIDTHLHTDHCGGNTHFDAETGQIVPTFPNAEYWVQRRELADASYPNERTRATYFTDNFAVLKQTGQLKVISGDTSVVDGVSTVITRGHTRAHQSILIESAGELGFYLADLAISHRHFERTAWVSAYDVEPLEQIESKRMWQHWAAETGAILFFEHDPQVAVGRLHKDGRHFKVEALTP